MRSSCFNSLIVFGGHVVYCSLFRPFLNILEGLFSFYFLATLAPLLLISKFLYVSMLFLFFFFSYFVFPFGDNKKESGVGKVCLYLSLAWTAFVFAYY